LKVFFEAENSASPVFGLTPIDGSTTLWLGVV